nr:Chain A, PawL-Derived Peptide PLP-22 [Inula racemosa]
GLPPYVD